jgi:hypothetical protein
MVIGLIIILFLTQLVRGNAYIRSQYGSGREVGGLMGTRRIIVLVHCKSRFKR